MTDKKTVEDIDVRNKTVLLRVDYNVPYHPGTTDISDDSRIRASLDTLRYLLDRNCKVVVCSHFGRPKGQVVDEMRLAPVSLRLSELLGKPVKQLDDCVGTDVKASVDEADPSKRRVSRPCRSPRPIARCCWLRRQIPRARHRCARVVASPPRRPPFEQLASRPS